MQKNENAARGQNMPPVTEYKRRFRAFSTQPEAAFFRSGKIWISFACDSVPLPCAGITRIRF